MRVHAGMLGVLLGVLVVCAAVPPHVIAQTGEMQDVQVTADSLSGYDRLIALRGNWRIRMGDDFAWKDPAFDDSAWEVGPSILRAGDAENMAPEYVRGPKWLRLHLNVAPEMRGKAVTVMSWVVGATEIYLDGERVSGHGRIVDEGDEIMHLIEYPHQFTITLNDNPMQVLAVRYAKRVENPIDVGPRHIMGFLLALVEPEYATTFVIELISSDVEERTFFGAMGLTIALIHLLLFIFYPRYLSNLFYALFTLSAAAMAYLPLKFRLANNIDDFAMWVRVFNLVLIAISLTGIRFLYSIFYDKMPRYFWAWAIGGVAVLIIFRNGPMEKVVVFTFVALIEMLRVLFIAIKNRRYGAWIVAVGSSAFIIASGYQMLMAFDVVPETTETAYLWGLLIMLVTMSIFLARGFATINTSLERQVIQIRELSDQALEQERRAKDQEMERIRLENENALKAKALEEARKRQKVLEELEQTNIELRRTQAQLVQSEKMAALGSLVAGVAHEINTPVGAITSMHDTLNRAIAKLRKSVQDAAPDRFENDPDIRKSFKVIEDASNVIESGSSRVTDIVRRLRSFARLDEAELKRVDIHEGIEDTLTLVHHELKRNVTVHKNYGKIPPIACYPGQLNQVFLNLLVNARQAIVGQGEITITTSLVDGKVEIRFADTGDGIPREKLSKIFDPGFTTKGVGVGTGLGLSICYQIVQAHHGTITVESEAGKGTTFTITLPTNLDSILDT